MGHHSGADRAGGQSGACNQDETGSSGSLDEAGRAGGNGGVDGSEDHKGGAGNTGEPQGRYPPDGYVNQQVGAEGN